MTNSDLEKTAGALVAPCKGILAADETVSTLTKRFDALRIQSTPASRRDYREMLLTAPGAPEFVSGVILHDETICQQTSAGRTAGRRVRQARIVPAIKVDGGAKPLAGAPGEHVTEGLDGRPSVRSTIARGATAWLRSGSTGAAEEAHGPALASVVRDSHDD